MADSDKFSIKITAEEGREDGLLSIKNTARRHCDVLAYVVSRERYEKSIRKQDDATKKLRDKLNCNGAYLLWGACDNEGDGRIYVGKSDGNFEGTRLIRHRTEKKWWRQVVIFTARSKDNPLNGSQVDYLEAELCRRAREAGRSSVDNGNKPGHPTNISDGDLQDVQAFLEEAISFLPMIGINAFLELDQPKEVPESTVQDRPAQTDYVQDPLPDAPTIFSMSGIGWSATGYPLWQDSGECRFVVRKGSTARVIHAGSLRKWNVNLRNKLVRDGVLSNDGEHLTFMRDYEFKSPSQAGAAVAGRESNGREEWKTQDKRTLKAVEEERS